MNNRHHLPIVFTLFSFLLVAFFYALAMSAQITHSAAQAATTECITPTAALEAFRDIPIVRVEGKQLEDFKRAIKAKYQPEAELPPADLIIIWQATNDTWAIMVFNQGCGIEGPVAVPARTVMELLKGGPSA